jgi:hypothetical protein
VTTTPAEELIAPAPLAAAETTPGPEAGPWARRSLLVVLVGVVLTVVGVILLPPDRILGATTRLVFFHGGIVWTAIIMSWTGAVLAVLCLFRRPARSRAAESSARGRPSASEGAPTRSYGLLQRGLSLATGFWVLTMALSFPVMILSWGGVRWDEERLWMTVEIVFLYLILYAFSLMIARPRATAVAWLVVNAVMGVLLATTPGSFHPDNPVFRSGSVRFIGGFLIVVLGLQLVAFGLLFLRRVAERSSLA